MFVVGMTGGIGSGKSTVSDAFSALGVPVIDTDVIARELTAPGCVALEAIRATFGDAVMQADGALDRAALRHRVFADDDARRRLEAILHPAIRQQVEQRLARLTARYALLVIPLLVETRAYQDVVKRILVVDCPEQTQVARVMSRNGLAREEVMTILAAQATRTERLAVADDVITNATSIDDLRAEVSRLNQRYLALAAEKMP
ncbi:MAG: dephospho-CoA kinase [Hydrogenophilales bacterium 12-61-10]|nr:MAG: dephospho-CoA kinase [Hydrogenophilales bacterium 12-61-10]OYX32161.1 MAG: dephospho-CoA kinase [Hydrogenophilales bacterium 32-62-9]OZA13805.1 MAG: dephospho-CoA kinase [Hydrogenophilales bacterium 17-62-8]